jgi:hypothetical protein
MARLSIPNPDFGASCNLRVSMNARANKQAKHQEPTHHHQARNDLSKAMT